MTTGIPYTIYTKKEIKDECKKNKDHKLYWFRYKQYKAGVIYETHSSFDHETLKHSAFYAMSEGWEQYTETGYYSTYFHTAKDEAPKFKKWYKDIVKRFKPVEVKPEPNYLI